MSIDFSTTDPVYGDFPTGTATPILPGYVLRVGTVGADSLTGDEAPDEIIAGFGADVVRGGGGGDVLFGGAGGSFVAGPMAFATARDEADRLSGGAGADWMDGAGGGDTLLGGAGDDTLIGGLGADRLTGGDGRDLFRFGLTPTGPDAGIGPAARDVVTDFVPDEDLLDLRGYRGDPGSVGTALAFVGDAPLAAPLPHGAVRAELREGGDVLLQLDLSLPWQAADGIADVEILLRGAAAAGLRPEDLLL